MANIKGDVRLGQHTLRMDFNALCDAEEDFPGIMNGEVDIRSFRSIRALVGHALAAHHPGLTPRDVGEIIHDAGIQEAAEAVTQAMQASFPPAEATASPNPRKAPAKAGAGTAR